MYIDDQNAGSVPERYVANVVTKRHIVIANAAVSEPAGREAANNECDTNADTCCLGRNFKILQ